MYNKEEIKKELSSLTKMNKQAREKKANSKGFKNYDGYKASLLFILQNLEDEEVKPTIHIVDIIDCSASMRGSKINSAVKGINKGILNLKEDKIANYTYTLCDFSDSRDINFKYVQYPLDKVNKINFSSRGMTALYDAIGITLEKVIQLKESDEKVLVNIYTDGDENCSKHYTSILIKDLIDELKSEGVTVTFIGTKMDTEYAIKTLGIERTNTSSYDGTAEGLKMSMEKTIVARAAYSTAVANGQDVSIGFYKNVN